MYAGLPKTRSDIFSGVRNHLLLAKTTPPTLPASQIPRKELQERVCRADGEAVVLIQAPAGFGKTTLMLQVMTLLRAQGVATSWLTLDAADNDVGRFLGFLDAAFDKLRSVAIGTEPENDVAAGVVALDLMERIACTPAPFVLFVDDAESLQNASSLAVLRQVIENLPEGCRMVIGSRAMLDIGAPRLLARGQLLTIEPTRLRFSVAETGDYLRDKRGLNMPGAEIARLQGATEGWPVALWLASVAIERSGRPVARTV
jgi:LuxR family transcriptional regulator, maltose regulon positive regulatory protein